MGQFFEYINSLPGSCGEARNKKVQTVQSDEIIYGWPQRKKKILDKSQLENIFPDKKFAILSP